LLEVLRVLELVGPAFILGEAQEGQEDENSQTATKVGAQTPLHLCSVVGGGGIRSAEASGTS
jgi:hypothetical protein